MKTRSIGFTRAVKCALTTIMFITICLESQGQDGLKNPVEDSLLFIKMGHAVNYFDTLITIRTARLENETDRRIRAEEALAAAIKAGEKDQKIIDLLKKQLDDAVEREEKAKSDLKEAERSLKWIKVVSKVKTWIIVAEAVVIGYLVLK